MINNVYTVKITNGRLTIPVEIRKKFGFLGKRAKVDADMKNGGLFLDFKTIKS